MSGEPDDAASAKVAVDYAVPHLTIKSTLSLTSAPKADFAGAQAAAAAGQLLPLLRSRLLLRLRLPGRGPTWAWQLPSQRGPVLEPSAPAAACRSPHPHAPSPAHPVPAVTTGYDNVTVGGSASYDTAKSALTKWVVGLGYTAADYQAAVMYTDKNTGGWARGWVCAVCAGCGRAHVVGSVPRFRAVPAPRHATTPPHALAPPRSHRPGGAEGGLCDHPGR